MPEYYHIRCVLNSAITTTNYIIIKCTTMSTLAQAMLIITPYVINTSLDDEVSIFSNTMLHNHHGLLPQ